MSCCAVILTQHWAIIVYTIVAMVYHMLNAATVMLCCRRKEGIYIEDDNWCNTSCKWVLHLLTYKAQDAATSHRYRDRCRDRCRYRQTAFAKPSTAGLCDASCITITCYSNTAVIRSLACQTWQHSYGCVYHVYSIHLFMAKDQLEFTIQQRQGPIKLVKAPDTIFAMLSLLLKSNH